jgi:hypothetical protein
VIESQRILGATIGLGKKTALIKSKVILDDSPGEAGFTGETEIRSRSDS